MGSGRIFLKDLRAFLFNEDLSKKPNFGWIHLAGQYLKVPIYEAQVFFSEKRYYGTVMKNGTGGKYLGKGTGQRAV
jgi:hypothetical protein